MFFIRADGNSYIGMGHIMRCLAIADALAQQGKEPVFLISSPESVSFIATRGFRAELINASTMDENDGMGSLIQELPELCAFLKKNTDVVLVDSYRATKEYLLELGKYAKVAYLDDLGQAWPVDLLINYNIYGPRYASLYEKESKKCLLGPKYMPMRGEFLQKSSYCVTETVKDVMITTGGSDPHLAAKAFAEEFLTDEELQKADLRFHIVSGPFNKRVDELKAALAENKNVFIYENIKSIRELMCRCDVVLTASGSTIYEVSSVGVPMLTFYFAENQKQGAEELEKIAGVPNCGDFSKDSQACVRKAVAVLRKLTCDREYREEISRREKVLVDGQGAERVASELIELEGAQ